MTRTVSSTRLVLILAFAISIRAKQSKTPREAALALNSDFEDGLSNREFRVDFPGVDDSSASIKIFPVGGNTPIVDYTIKGDVKQAQTVYFEEKDAPAGSYEVQVCSPSKECSMKRAAFGEIFSDEKMPTLSCIKGNGEQENAFHTFKGESEEFNIAIQSGESFISDYSVFPDQVLRFTAYSKLGLNSNPAYKTTDGTNVFYAAVWYNGKHVKQLFDTVAKESQEMHAHEYCKRKYIFWASAHVVDQETKVVLRRFRGTIIANDLLAQRFILDDEAPSFPVEFARYDEEKLPPGKYGVSVSFCATDKDVINSSICSKALYSELTVA